MTSSVDVVLDSSIVAIDIDSATTLSALPMAALHALSRATPPVQLRVALLPTANGGVRQLAPADDARTLADVQRQHRVILLPVPVSTEIVQNLNDVVAARGKTISDLRNKIKALEQQSAKQEQLLRDTARKVGAFWSECLATFVASSSAVMAGGEFPTLGNNNNNNNNNVKTPDDDDDDDDDSNENFEENDDGDASPRLVSAPKLRVDSDSESSESSSNDRDAAPSSSSSAAAASRGRVFRSLREHPLKELHWPQDVIDVRSSMREIFQKPIDVGTTYRDIPRLARRVVVSVNGQPGPASLATPSRGTSVNVATAELVRTLVSQLESFDDERLKSVNALCDKLALVEPHESSEPMIAALVATGLGANSATAAVLRCLSQNVVLPISLFLKAHTVLLTKDVPSADGWRIEVAITGDSVPRTRVVVLHTRKEKSLSDAAFENFSFAYELRFALHGAALDDVDVRFVARDFDARAVDAKVTAALAVLDTWNAISDDVNNKELK